MVNIYVSAFTIILGYHDLGPPVLFSIRLIGAQQDVNQTLLHSFGEHYG